MVGNGVDPSVAEARHGCVDYARVGAVDADAAVVDAFGQECGRPCEYLLAASVVVESLGEVCGVDGLGREVAAREGEAPHQ